MQAAKIAAKWRSSRPPGSERRVNNGLLASGLSLAVLTLMGTTAQATLLLTEDFNYAAGTLLTANGWAAHTEANSNPQTVASSGLTYSGYAQSGIGKAAQLSTSGEDDDKAIPSLPWTGSVYLAAMVNLSAVQSGDYFLAFMNVAGTKESYYCTRLYVKTTTGGFLMGLAKGSGAAITYGATVYSLNTTYLVVLKYTFNTGSGPVDTVALYVNPTPGGSEPSATIGPLSDATTADFSVISFVGLRQGGGPAQAPTVQVDGIRVATTWEEAVAAACTTPATPTASNNGPVCSGTTLSLSTPAVTGATYGWTGPNGFTSSVQNPTVSSSATAAMAGTYNVTITVNGCTSAAGTTVVTVNAAASTSAITGSSSVAIGQAGKTYSVTLTSGSSYAWIVPGGASITAGTTGPNNNQITVTFGSASGDVTVTETTSGGCVGSPVPKGITVGPNHAPIANGSSKTCTKGLSAKVKVTGSGGLASDADSDPLAITKTAPGHGSATVVGDYIVYQNNGTGTSDSFDYTVDDGQGGTASATVSVTVADPSEKSQNQVSIEDLGGGQVRISFLGIPTYNYALESTADSGPSYTWTPLVTQAADATGLVEYTITPEGSPTFYRTRWVP
jgi:hypothetical protein